ncbi:MAG: T9SS type A sorting domain-containing protein [Candidatus Cloacimonetes bacterium]|nr:T9SS type A sorting domain-containing protein [Candidatus Cloacimonadota bacterium]
MLQKASLVILFVLSCTILLADGVQPEGDGTQADPYQVATLDNLLWVSTNNASWTCHFIQTANIDATDTQNWNDGTGFRPIGIGYANRFSGRYDGQGHTIDGLFFNRHSNNYQGMFGRTEGAIIENLGVTNIDVSGSSYAGGLVGKSHSSSTIINCYSTGSVSGSIGVGGLVGSNADYSCISNSFSTACVIGTSYGAGGFVGNSSGYSTIANCYSKGAVNGRNRVGGLVGSNDTSSIINCYSTGRVEATGTDVGGMVGFSTGYASNSFWDNESSWQSESAGGTGLYTADMVALSTFVNAGWDFMDETANGTHDFWGMNYMENGGYPFLEWQGYNQELPEGVQPAGSGIEADPYQVATLDNLLWISLNDSSWAGHFIQTADIDANCTQVWNGGQGFEPIGICAIYPNDEIPFTGNYDGMGHEIVSMYINRRLWNCQALFGYISGAVITNLGVIDVSVSGYSEVGGLVGRNFGSSIISNCYTVGSVNGIGDVGGLVGRNGDESPISGCHSAIIINDSGYGGVVAGGLVGDNGDESPISNCYSTGSVYGNYIAGGLVGWNAHSTINNCHSVGSVSGGFDSAGGLVGAVCDTSTVSNCYSTGNVNGYWHVGGLVGVCYDHSTINNCYSTGSVDGNETTGGLVGVCHDNSTINNCYSTGSVSAYRSVGGLVGDSWSSSIANCYSTGSVDGSDITGGLVGGNWTSLIENCYSVGNVDGHHAAGGFAGVCHDNSTVSNCYSTGDVEGDSYVGGLVGGNWTSLIENCYSTSNVNGDDKIGGLVGAVRDTSTVNNCYTTGSVSGDEDVGGLVGWNEDSNVSTSFWDIETSGQTISAGGAGLATAEMQTQSTFTDVGWDFAGETANGTEDYWIMDETHNDGYPYLNLQNYAVGVGDDNAPAVTALNGNYPNPFNPTTTIVFSLAEPAHSTLCVYNVRGQRVRQLLDEARDTGSHEVLWNGRDDHGAPCASGLYLYRLEAGGVTNTRKMLLLK